MRILLSNKFYYRRGGDCVCVINLEELLKEKGHEVAIFAMQHPENIPTIWSQYFPSEVKFQPNLGLIETLMRPFGTSEVKRKFTALLNDFKPDVVHFHNIHSQISPIIGEIAYNRGIKIVWTNHDYKLLCPRYDCLRNGQNICEECFIDKHKVLEYKCMKNSILGSILAYKEAIAWSRERLEKFTSAFIGPSQFMVDKMAQGGFDRSKLHTICNFVNVEKTLKDNYNKEEYYCFIGRLSHEKGIQTLIAAASQLPYKLKIIGGGPLVDELSHITSNKPNIEMMGYKQWDEIKEIVGKARFSVIPSEWYENNPMSVIESQCLGTPVLGANIGGIPELIENGVSGMIFESRNVEDLTNKIEQMFAHNFDFQKLAAVAQHDYSSEIHYDKLIKIYCE